MSAPGGFSKPPLRSRLGPSQQSGTSAAAITGAVVPGFGSPAEPAGGHQLRSVNTFRQDTNRGDRGTFVSTLNASARITVAAVRSTSNSATKKSLSFTSASISAGQYCCMNWSGSVDGLTAARTAAYFD